MTKASRVWSQANPSGDTRGQRASLRLMRCHRRLAQVLGGCACACGLASSPDTETTGETQCVVEQAVDVRFLYHTDSEVEAATCVLEQLGAQGDELLITTDCGYAAELDGVAWGSLELAVGDTVSLLTRVTDPQGLGCAEQGWQIIYDTQERMQLALASVLEGPEVLSLDDLGDVELSVVEDQGCPALELRTQDDLAYVPEASSAEIELSGARLQVEVGLFSNLSTMGCGPEQFSVVLIRLPD